MRNAATNAVPHGPMSPVARKERGAARIPSPVVGAAAGLGMLVVYVVVVLAASRSLEHLIDQVTADWYLIVPISAGSGVQVGLLMELRRLHRLHRLHRDIAAAGTVGAATSTVGMLACCAHHVADVLPFLGVTAAATFLYRYRLPFMLVGLAANAVAIATAFTRLRALQPSLGGPSRMRVR